MYPDTTQPSAPVELVHERSTFVSPAVGVTVGIVTVGNVKKPALRVKLIIVDVPIPNSPKASSSMKLAEVDRPQAVLITGSSIRKDALLKTSALIINGVRKDIRKAITKSSRRVFLIVQFIQMETI